MGYPDWTLLGMGLSILGALVALTFALLGQSPGMMQRLGLVGARLDLRVRSFTTYAFALLVLTIGFFLAGIPVGTDSAGSELAGDAEISEENGLTSDAQQSVSELDSGSSDQDLLEGSESVDPDLDTGPTEASTPESGSFSGPPPSLPTTGPDAGETDTLAEIDGPVTDSESDSPPREDSGTPQASPTPTTVASPTPTATPSPTITPTPIADETAIVSSGGSTVWITRSPGGQNLTLVRDGDLVLILSGHANQAGLLWREVRTVNGILGWIQEAYLDYGE